MKNDSQQIMQEEFLDVLEKYLGVRHEKVNISERWSTTGPKNARDIPLSDFMKKVCRKIQPHPQQPQLLT